METDLVRVTVLVPKIPYRKLRSILVGRGQTVKDWLAEEMQRYIDSNHDNGDQENDAR